MNRIEMLPELEGLADNYSKVFPNYPKLIVDKGWLYGVWVVGNRYASKHGFYGEFPGNFLKRVVALFPNAKTVLHAFSGMVEKGMFVGAQEYTIDANPDLSPDIVGNVESFSASQQFDVILADPPYTKEDAGKYGLPLPNKKKSVANLAHHLSNEGYLCWLDTMLPMHTKTSLLFVGAIGVIQSGNHRVRLLALFRKVNER